MAGRWWEGKWMNGKHVADIAVDACIDSPASVLDVYVGDVHVVNVCILVLCVSLL
jgi:hypothetical protein